MKKPKCLPAIHDLTKQSLERGLDFTNILFNLYPVFGCTVQENRREIVIIKTTPIWQSEYIKVYLVSILK